MRAIPPARWFDAHLDLACLAENGRDMTLPPERCAGPWPPATLTFPSLAEGNVKGVLGTIFTELNGDDAVAYPDGDAQAAHDKGVRQLERYHRWHAEGLIRLISSTRRALAEQRLATIEASKPVSSTPRLSASSPSCLILMECADPIREPAELAWWAERGVAAIGLAWARGSRYASGNSEPSCSSAIGLTDLGRQLVSEMDRLGIVHDASHLSDRALSDLFALTDRPVIASHSNVRALLDGKSQRHLTDEAIREIGRRAGVIGLNLVRNFIRTGLNRDDPGDRPSIAEAINHVERICELMGHRRGVGMGSDLDGGISGHDLPRGIDRPRDFVRFAEELAARGWSDAEVEAFAWGNWARFWGLDRAGA